MPAAGEGSVKRGAWSEQKQLQSVCSLVGAIKTEGMCSKGVVDGSNNNVDNKKLAQMIPINKSHYTRRISFAMILRDMTVNSSKNKRWTETKKKKKRKGKENSENLLPTYR